MDDRNGHLDLLPLIEELWSKLGHEQLRRILEAQLESQPPTSNLVIVPCSGSHPEEPLRQFGEIFHASEGLLDLTNAQSAHKSFSKALVAVRDKLCGQLWGKVYLATFGPAVLTAQIKLAVYKVLHTETVDLLHVNGRYFPITIDLRSLLRGTDDV